MSSLVVLECSYHVGLRKGLNQGKIDMWQKSREIKLFFVGIVSPLW
jgi:hypothetical protein